MNLLLYSTDNCQLCDEAQDLIHRALTGHQYQLRTVNIRDSAQLMKKYALRIPVLALENGNREELRWPFTVEDVHVLVNVTH